MPRKTKRKTPVIAYLDDEDYGKLHTMAEANGMSESAVARMIIHRALASTDNSGGFSAFTITSKMP